MDFTFLGLIGGGALAALVLYFFFIYSQRARGVKAKYSITLIALLALVGLAGNTLASGLVFINPQERAIVLSPLSSTGYRGTILTPGLQFVVPFLERVERITIAQQAYTMSRTTAEGQVKGDDSVTARTADGQEVYVDATIQYQVDETKVTDLFIKWQKRYETDFVRPQARSIVYNLVSQYKVEEVYSTKRLELQARMTDELRATFAKDGIKLTALLLRNIAFSPEYAKSVEEKQIAQQNAERAKFLVQQEEQEAARVRVKAQGEGDAVITRAKADAEARVLAARAEAEALKLVSEALRANPDLLTYRYIEKIAPTIDTIILPSGQNFILDPRSLINQNATPTPTPRP